VARRRHHATLYDFRDLDLLIKIRDFGAVTSHELAEMIGVDQTGSRLGWMTRFGMLDKNDDGLWELSPGGLRVVQARLKASTANALDAVPDEAMVDVMAHVVSRFNHRDAMLGHMLRREFLYGTKPR